MTTVARDSRRRQIGTDVVYNQADAGTDVEASAAARPVTIPRDSFLREYFTYKPGEHLTLLGPTQSGKTTLASQLLKVTTYPKLPGVVLVMKPRDAVVSAMAESLDYQIVRDWPPPVHTRHRVKTRGRVEVQKPPGYMVWPKHTFDPDRDDAHLAAVFRRTIRSNYAKGDAVLFCDEIYGLSKELGLERDLNAVWSRGSAMGCGLWASSQRPYGIPQWAYTSPEHIFLAKDPDKRDRDRYGEIGGVDPDLVKDITMTLPKYHWLYIHRSGPEMCIVSA